MGRYPYAAECKKLKERIKELEIEKYKLVVPIYMWGMLERGEIKKEDLDKWYKQALKGK